MEIDSLAEIIDFKSYRETIPRILDRLDTSQVFAGQQIILLKPNLVNASAHPVTTSPDFCAAVIEYIQQCTDNRIILAEGCGDADYETTDIFRILGFEDLAKTYNVELMDLNTAPVTKISEPANQIFPRMVLPEIAFKSYIVSLPVLKAHSLAKVTGTLKNMMGFAPPKYYSGGGFWKKAVFHNQMQQSIIELNRVIKPALTVLDASIGLQDYHLGGPECSPPINKIIAGFDPRKVDMTAAHLLGMDWRRISHISDT